MSQILKDLENEFAEKKREVLEYLLEQCTDGQQEKFFRIFGPTENIAEDRVGDAIAICERTIKKNEKKAAGN